ncbi:MAG: AraC family transcriptional regulator [Acidobacteriaceae bacterium]|nr:AraC family transcriptional regulator [Acidobacteriaceae bacterium]
MLPHVPEIVDEKRQKVKQYQRERPSNFREYAHIWSHTALQGVDVLLGSYRTYQAARHFHAEPTIGIVAQGAMSFYCRGASHILPPGAVFLLNPEEVHAQGPAIPDGWMLRALHFEDSLFRILSANLAVRRFGFQNCLYGTAFLPAGCFPCTVNWEGDGAALELESSLLTILARLAAGYVYEPVHIPATTRDTVLVKSAKEYINAYHNRNITLSELACIAQVSPYHLLRTFRSSVGLTPHSYLIQTRIEAAKRLLCMGKPIAEVSGETGFTDQSHFTRHFRRITGVTPARYLPRHSYRRNLKQFPASMVRDTSQETAVMDVRSA